MKAKNNYYFLLASFFFFSFFISCNKQELETTIPESNTNLLPEIDTSFITSKSSGASPIYTDSSGSIQVQVFFKHYNGQHNSGQMSVGSDYVLIGGGAWASKDALITKSAPLLDGRTWTASSKDHHYPSNHQLTVYAIGLKIIGVNKFTLAQNIKINALTTNGLPVGSPSLAVNLDNQYTLVGGGAHLDANCTLCTGGANLLYKSAPNGNGWIAAGKEHIYGGYSKLTTYAIGIRTSFLQSLNIEVISQQASVYSSGGIGHASLDPESGSVLVGVGATAGYHGAGRLLTHISPWGNHAFSRSKDHGFSDYGNTTVYSWSLRKR